MASEVQAMRLWRRLGGSGLGRWVFTRIVCLKAPYFASISPRLVRLEPGYCEAWLRQRRRVQNHIGTVHAIALCNLAELCAGLVTDVSIPRDMRWIPQDMTALPAQGDGAGHSGGEARHATGDGIGTLCRDHPRDARGRGGGDGRRRGHPHVAKCTPGQDELSTPGGLAATPLTVVRA